MCVWLTLFSFYSTFSKNSDCLEFDWQFLQHVSHIISFLFVALFCTNKSACYTDQAVDKNIFHVHTDTHTGPE